MLGDSQERALVGIGHSLLIPDPRVRAILRGRQDKELVVGVEWDRVGSREDEETVSRSVGVHFEKAFPKKFGV